MMEQTVTEFDGAFVPATHHVSDLVPLFANEPNPTISQEYRSLSFCGHVHAVRDHGEVIFIDLRDRHQLIQIVCDPELCPESFEQAKKVKVESTLKVSGYLRRRPKETENPVEQLGFVEIVGEEVELLGVCASLPYPVHDDAEVHEAVRLKHRYLQLRKKSGLRSTLVFRSRFVNAFKAAFLDREFVDVETPILFRSTPEGARDFVVPSRHASGNFYALVQSPQLMKQLLMIGGLERYVQVCRCFRDEDLRADRQPEFTQLDLEAAFVDPSFVRRAVEEALRVALGHCLSKEQLVDDFKSLCEGGQPIRHMTHAEAVQFYGTDAPDLRFDLPIYDGTQVFTQTRLETFRKLIEKGARLRFLCLPGKRPKASDTGELSRSFLDTLPGFAQEFGGQGLAWLRKQDDGTWQGPIAKFLSAEELSEVEALVVEAKHSSVDAADLQAGTMLFFSCHLNTKVVSGTLGELRLKIARELGLVQKRWALTWITDFPQFEWDSQLKRLSCAHHPFTHPSARGVQLLLERQKTRRKGEGLASQNVDELLALHSTGFDLVLNGKEVGGGSARIHQADLQRAVFRELGLSDDEISSQFGFFMDALSTGAPPHCGMALGLDRLVSLLLEQESIRDVIAFPKSGGGQCLLSGAPSQLPRASLRELGIVCDTGEDEIEVTPEAK